MNYFIWTVHPLCLDWLGLQISWYSCFLSLSWILSFLYFDRQTARFCYSNEGDIIKIAFLLLFLLGARLGTLLEERHLALYTEKWTALFFLNEGGLVGQVGGLFSLIGTAILHLILKSPDMPFLLLFDWISISLLPCLVLVRIGNFFNHEILGLKTESWLGVIFAYSEGQNRSIPVHPVQLYEAFGYFLGYIITRKTTHAKSPPGTLFSKLCFILGSIRFILEFFKADLERGFPSLGQLLSLPFIFLGLVLLFWLKRDKILI